MQLFGFHQLTVFGKAAAVAAPLTAATVADSPAEKYQECSEVFLVSP